MSNKKTSDIIEHKYFVLDTDEKNKNHRTYVKSVADKWREHESLKNDEGGIDVEYALDKDADIEKEYLQDSMSCGKVIKLEYEDDTKLYVTIRFKKNELTEDIYSGKIPLDSLSVVPKGKGSVKNQRVQDDYELFGFNLVKAQESSFATEEAEAESA